jgi:hypothetical protein
VLKTLPAQRLTIQQGATSGGTIPLHFAAPLLGVCAGAVRPLLWSLSLTLGAAVVCVCLSYCAARMDRASSMIRHARTISFVSGLLVYLLAVRLVWQGIGRMDRPDPDVVWVLISLVLIMISFAGWLPCTYSKGATALGFGCLSAASSAGAMFALQVFP